MKKIQSLQGFRALGFICVFLWHCGKGNAGTYAVSLFVRLSGFLLMFRDSGGVEERRQTLACSVKSAMHKIWKLYPLHIMMFISAYVYYEFISKQLSHVHIIVRSLSNVLLLQSCIPFAEFWYYSFNGPSWYLSLTFFLYCAFPYIKARIKKSNPITMSFFLYLGMIVYCVIASKLQIPAAVKKWLVYISPIFRCFDFAIGCCAGMIVKRGGMDRKKANGAGIMFLILSMISISIFAAFRSNQKSMAFIYSLIYVPAIFTGLLSLGSNQGFLSKIFSVRVFARLGDISGYAFLIHGMAMCYVSAAVSKINWNVLRRADVKNVTAFIVTILLAFLYEYLIKKYTNRKVGRLAK